MPDCGAPGEYRAPKSRRDLREYWWFCLEHVRAYNSTWDYYKGMSPAEMERELALRHRLGRPSWPLGRLGAVAWDDDALRDPLHILAMRDQRRQQRRARGANAPPHETPGDLRAPLSTLGLSWPTTLDAVKTRYQGTGETASSRRQRRQPGRGRASENHQSRLRHLTVPAGRGASAGVRRIASPRLRCRRGQPGIIPHHAMNRPRRAASRAGSPAALRGRAIGVNFPKIATGHSGL